MDNEGGRNIQESEESRLKWCGHVLRREEEYVGKRVMVMERCRGKEGEEDQREGGWITSRMTCRRENCQGRKLKTESNGGVS